MYTLLQPSKSHLWILLFLESGDSDLRGRRMLSILKGDMELQQENKNQHISIVRLRLHSSTHATILFSMPEKTHFVCPNR